jgi:hypothetical protein
MAPRLFKIFLVFVFMISVATHEEVLYDLANDRTELNDLASQHPDKVELLTALWMAWAEKVGVKPWKLTKVNLELTKETTRLSFLKIAGICSE